MQTINCFRQTVIKDIEKLASRITKELEQKVSDTVEENKRKNNNDR